MMRQKTKNLLLGFTLIELLVVIAIIGILSTLAVVALSNARSKARDSKRVADIQQISKALALYYADNSSYPVIITPGQSLKSPDGLNTYMANIPNNPTPRNDGNCPDSNYGYTYITNTNSYYLYSCTGNSVGSLGAGSITIKPDSSLTNEPVLGLIGWWKFNEGSGVNVADSSGYNHPMVITGSGYEWRSGSQCKTGSCVYFPDTAYAYGVVGTTFDLGTGDFSYSAWVNHTRRPDLLGSDFFGNYPHGGQYGDISVGNVDYSTTVFLMNSKYPSGPAVGCSFDYAPYFGSWHLLSITKNSSKVYMYVDDITPPVASCDVSGDYNININSQIWNINTGWRPGFITISDHRVFNRALSAAEVAALYNATK